MTPAVEGFTALEEILEKKRLQVEAALAQLQPRGRADAVDAAVAYSLFAPAKRLRPVLSLIVADILRADPRAVLPAACSVEMVHTASLILDDLPCMDDAAARRGRAACHVVHGEATAILAAFTLLNRAFEILAEDGRPGRRPPRGGRVFLARDLSRAVGLRRDDLPDSRETLEMTDRDHRLPDASSSSIAARRAPLHGLGREWGRGGARERRRASTRVTTYCQEPGPRLPDRGRPHRRHGRADRGGEGRRAGLKKTTFVSFSGVRGRGSWPDELIASQPAGALPFGREADPLRDSGALRGGTKEVAMTRCPECESDLDLDGYELDQGETINCPSAPSSCEWSRTTPWWSTTMGD
jgi:hypothetical protein